MTSRDRYNAAHKLWFAQEYPGAFKDGHYTPPLYPKIETANGLTTAIINHLKFTGNYGNRINVAGRMIGGITKTESGATFNDRRWIKSSTKKGTEDIDAILFKNPVKFEVKVGRDKQSEKQQEHQKKIERAGGKYFIVRTMEDYFEIFDRLERIYNESNFHQCNLF